MSLFEMNTWLLQVLAMVLAVPGVYADVLDAPPGTPDPEGHFVIYLHGAIVTGSDGRPVSPLFGAYEYRDILTALSAGGQTVISEIRTDDTDLQQAAARVVGWIQVLQAAGVPGRNIAVVGASMGGIIAAQVAHAVEDDAIRYVLIASTYNMRSLRPFSLHGHVLAIHDRSDDRDWVTEAYFAASPDLAGHRIVITDTGLGHGLLYTPHPAWVQPALAWIRGAPW